MRLALFVASIACPALPAQDAPVVCATTPDLGALARTIGGDGLTIITLVPGPTDPHFVDPRPGMLAALRDAAALIDVGRDLEVGWLPVLVDNARNAAILPGQSGRITVEAAVRRLGVPPPGTDRSQGDVHAEGNPHFLTDPVCGLQVADYLRRRFAALWPGRAPSFDANFARLRSAMATAMVGAPLAQRYDHDAERLGLLFGAGKLETLLREQGDLEELGGWFARMGPRRNTPVVVDHDQWIYFAERFGLRVVSPLEPRPGLPPTVKHLAAVVATMRKEGVRIVCTAPYFPPQHARKVASTTGAVVVPLAHQAGARPGTEDYLAFVDHNVRQIVMALEGR